MYCLVPMGVGLNQITFSWKRIICYDHKWECFITTWKNSSCGILRLLSSRFLETHLSSKTPLSLILLLYPTSTFLYNWNNTSLCFWDILYSCNLQLLHSLESPIFLGTHRRYFPILFLKLYSKQNKTFLTLGWWRRWY